MNYVQTAQRIAEYRRQIAAIRQQMREAQAAVEPQQVSDYEFRTAEGTVRLSQLFGDRDQLIVIHNMGRSCPACTLWADGYNGLHEHVTSRAGFVVTSPDAPEVQRDFAASRGWKFRMVSHAGSTFAADMGFRGGKGNWVPGVSVFQRQGEKIVRVSEATFSPGDDFCTLWHLFDLLPGGAGDFRPRYQY